MSYYLYNDSACKGKVRRAKKKVAETGKMKAIHFISC